MIFSLWLRVIWTMVNMLCAIVALVCGYILVEEEIGDLEMLGYVLLLGSFFGGLIGVIGNFWTEEYCAGLSLGLFVLLAILFVSDVRE